MRGRDSLTWEFQSRPSPSTAAPFLSTEEHPRLTAGIPLPGDVPQETPACLLCQLLGVGGGDCPAAVLFLFLAVAKMLNGP